MVGNFDLLEIDSSRAYNQTMPVVSNYKQHVTLVNSDARLVLRRNLNGATARESKLKAKLQPWTAVSTLFYTFSFPLQMRSSRFRSNMNTKFLLLVALLMSRISVFQATLQCPAAEKSIDGMFLRGHTFKTTKVGWPGGCYLMCEEEVKCQSYNFVIGHKICELNNRTKEARPEDFKPDQTKLYMKRRRNRGTLQLYIFWCLSPFKNSAIRNAS